MTSPTVLSQFESSKNVFIAKVVSVEKSEVGSNQMDGIEVAKMVVQKTYKGNFRVGEELFFSEGSINCNWTYEKDDVGKELLIYSAYFGENSKIGYIFGCSRTRNIENAGDDLLFLNKLEEVKGKSRVSGTVNYWDKKIIEGVTPPKRKLDGHIVKITNIKTNKTYEIKTDINGAFEIYDLPAGMYNVGTIAPDGWKISDFLSDVVIDYQEFEKLEKNPQKAPEELITEMKNREEGKYSNSFAVYLFPNRHAGIDFTFEIDNAITGTVFDSNGNPLEGVNIRLLPIGGEKYKYFYKSDYSDKNGEFSIDEVPTGNYILVINEDNKITESNPFNKFYHPYTNDPAKATVISIKEGQFIKGIEIHVPKTEETITIEGRFLYSDGKPVVNETVKFKTTKNDTSFDGDSSTSTDSEGQFKLKILKGMEGKIYGEMFTYIGEFENCPSIEKLIKAQGEEETSMHMKTNEVVFQANENMKDLELKYNFTGCIKAKE